MWIYLLLVILLILLSAFFSASETALTSLSLSSVTEKAKKGNKSAKIILQLFNDKSSLITVLLMANTFINIFFTTLSTSLGIKYLGNNYIFFIALLNSIIILLFGEIIPKTYSFNKPMGLALTIAPMIYILIKILTPFTKILLIINNLFLKLLTRKNIHLNRFDSLENLRGAIELFESNNKDDSNEKKMLHSLLDLHDIYIGEIMIHRKNVFCIDIDTPQEDLITEILKSNNTKIPIYKDSKDNIIGILYTKEFLKYYFKNKEQCNIQDLIKKPVYFPETTDAFDLLIFLQESTEKIVIVVDEYGGFMGIVCVSDILEEIVGELKLNHINHIQKCNNNSYIVNGDLTIRVLNRKLKWNLPDDKAITIAGLILYETGKIPNPGNIFALHNFKFEILEKKKQQIKKIKITPLQTSGLS